MIEPASLSSTPVIRLNTVLLPAPLGPISPRISPLFISNETSFTATSPPNRLTSPLTSSSVPPPFGLARRASGGASAGLGFGGPAGRMRESAGASPSRVRCSRNSISTPNTTIS